MNAHRSAARWVAMTGAGIAVLLLSACAGTTTTSNSTPSGFTGPPVPAGSAVVQTGIPAVGAGGNPDAGFNTVDLVFLQQMIPHHEQALRLLALAGTNGASPEIQQVAATEQTAIPNEVNHMSTSLASLGLAPTADLINGVHQHAGGMTEADVTKCATLKGKDFDSDFVDLLTKHTLGSVELARAEAEQGFNTGTRAMASAIARRDSDLVLNLSNMGN